MALNDLVLAACDLPACFDPIVRIGRFPDRIRSYRIWTGRHSASAENCPFWFDLLFLLGRLFVDPIRKLWDLIAYHV